MFRSEFYLLILISKKNFFQTANNKNDNKLNQHTIQEQDDANIVWNRKEFQIKKNLYVVEKWSQAI